MIKDAKIIGTRVNPDLYHAVRQEKRGSLEFVMSPSTLREFGICPRRFIDGYESPQSDAKIWGSLVDALVLTPEQVPERFAVTPETYVRDGVEKAWRNDSRIPEVAEWIEASKGKQVVASDLMRRANEAVARLGADDIIHSWQDACETQVWVGATWGDRHSGLCIPIRALLDYVPRDDSEFSQCAGDLKTVRSGSLRQFKNQVYQYGWHIQAAFCIDLLNAAKQQERASWCWVIQESFEPYQTGRRLCSARMLSLGRATYQRLLYQYCKCIALGKWPDYDDHPAALQGWSLVDAEDWMEFAEAEAGSETEPVADEEWSPPVTTGGAD